MSNITAINKDAFPLKVVQKYLELALKVQGIGDEVNIYEFSKVISELEAEYPPYQGKIFRTRFGLESGESIADTDKVLQACNLQEGIKFESKVPGIPSFSMKIDNIDDGFIDLWLRDLSKPEYLSRYTNFSS